MRFILRYKYGILQTKTERIDVNFCENTTQILEYLQRKVSLSRNKIIVRFKHGKSLLRILPNWSLEDYGLEEGAELHIESIEDTETDKKNDHINNRYLNNILGMNKFNSSQMEEVKQKQNEEEEDTPNNQFSVRKYLDRECEVMLKEIQRNNLEGFRNIFERIPEDVPEEFLVEVKDKKLFLIDELGEKGWGAIHYAVFCRSYDILDELLALEVDVNKSTSDGWLPIQLAIEIKDQTIIRKLLEESPLNLNLQTIRGTALHTAARLGCKEILSLLLEQEIDVHAKDNSAKTAFDVCLDEECKLLLKRLDDKSENQNEYVKATLPLSLTTIFRGTLLKAKRPFMNLKERYLLVDPFQGSIIRYENPSDYPKRAKEVTPLSKLKGIKLIAAEEKSWFMKDQFSYFIIEEPNKEVYACKHRRAAQSWVSNLALAVEFSEEFEKNPQIISDIKRNEIIIEDVEEQELPKKLKKSKKSLFSSSLYSRQSTISNRSFGKEQRQLSEIVPPVTTQIPASKQTTEETSPTKQPVGKKSQQKLYTEQFNSIANNKVNFASFNIIKILGSGAFGKVFLVRHIASGKQYALKALKKKELIVKKNLKYAIFEANILKQANSPFIINLYYAFQTPNYLYLTLDYCPGKDLSFHIAREVTFTEEDSKFYVAELLLAIEHLHEKKIIYRDLKPENILLDEDGHVKLADFGLSKQMGVDDKTKSFCGSPAYLSPEMLSQRGVGRQSDIYGIGTVLFELLIGEPPYFSEDVPTLYRNIRQGKLKFPKSISENAKKIILALLERQPKKRIGYSDLSQIKRHPFFHSIDWQKLERKQLEPPKRPVFDDSDDDDDQLELLNNKNTKFVDYDYDDQNKKINRLTNFSFMRE